MSVDKLVDSTQLDADLTSVANAIRTKGGTSAQLAFPADFVQAIEDIEAGGGSVTHVQYTAASDATSAGTGGSAGAFQSAYITPNIPSSGNVILVCFITNNNASGNYARAWFYCRDTKLRGSTLNIYWRGAGSYSHNMGTNYDYYYTSGSLIDVWVLEDVLT